MRGTLREDLCTSMKISYRIFLRMINISDRYCRENENTHFMFSTFFMGHMMVQFVETLRYKPEVRVFDSR